MIVARTRLFVDFGSTFTKLVAFDLEAEELARPGAGAVHRRHRHHRRASSRRFRFSPRPSTWRDDERRQTVACSSAAGGLRVVCVGLVPEYTTEAGRRAALGAGAKIVGSYSFELSHVGDARDRGHRAPTSCC